MADALKKYAKQVKAARARVKAWLKTGNRQEIAMLKIFQERARADFATIPVKRKRR